PMEAAKINDSKPQQSINPEPVPAKVEDVAKPENTIEASSVEAPKINDDKPQQPITPEPTTAKVEEVATDIEPESAKDPTSLYLFGDPQSDRARLAAQTVMSISSIRKMAPQLIKGTVNDILDLGCGDGQLGMFLSTVYRNARVLGVDIDPVAIETA